jgi:hypothetical protein
MYEQYRIRRVRIYAYPGAHMTNDLRIKAKVLARVDRDNFKPYSAKATLGFVASATNTVTKMLPDCRKQLIADYQPICKPFLPGGAISDGRQLPNPLSWMAIRDVNSNYRFVYDEWLGCQMALLLPDENFPPEAAPEIALQVRVDVQFRGRVYNNIDYTVTDLTQPKPSDVSDTQDHLRNALLTGVYFPMSGFENINIANIGTDPTIDATGCQYRDQATQNIYEIVSWDNTTWTYNADQVLLNLSSERHFIDLSQMDTSE